MLKFYLLLVTYVIAFFHNDFCLRKRRICGDFMTIFLIENSISDVFGTSET